MGSYFEVENLHQKLKGLTHGFEAVSANLNFRDKFRM